MKHNVEPNNRIIGISINDDEVLSISIDIKRLIKFIKSIKGGDRR